MKAKLNAMLACKMPSPLFLLTCLLLIVVGVTSRIMVDNAALVMDSTIEQLTHPQPGFM